MPLRGFRRRGSETQHALHVPVPHRPAADQAVLPDGDAHRVLFAGLGQHDFVGAACGPLHPPIRSAMLIAMKRHLEVAVVQNSAGRDAAANLDRIERMLADVGDVDLVMLPEVFALRGGDADLREGAEAVGGRLTDRLAEWARRAGAWSRGV